MQTIQQQLTDCYYQACMAELQAIKPGNVHVFADGHQMTVDDFVQSAELTAPLLAHPDWRVGERVKHAILATRQAVGCNTNLGIVLLVAPLMQTALHLKQLPNAPAFSLVAFKKQLAQVLATLNVTDAIDVAEAIRIAGPAGLGQVDAHDVNDFIQVNLFTLMQAAEHRDWIAYQYTHDYDTVLTFGLSQYQQAFARWQNAAWATTAVFLYFLSHFPDSHIARKYGDVLARQVMQEAQDKYAAYIQADNPKLQLKTLLDWDTQLKERHINPGTSADLTVAVLFMVKLLA